MAHRRFYGRVMSSVISSPATMLAYVGTPTGPELRQVPTPDPAPGEALVEVDVFTVNRGELGRLHAAGGRLRDRRADRVFMRVTIRATFAVPPRHLRAYPYLNRC